MQARAIQDENLMMARNLACAMSAYSRWSVSGETVRLPAVTLVNAQLDYSVFNAAVITETLAGREELEYVLDTAAEYYERHGLDWSCWMTEELLSAKMRVAFLDQMAARRMWLVAEHQGMIAERLEPGRSEPVAMTARPVCDAATRLDFAHLCIQVFGMPATVAEQVYSEEGFWSGGFQAWVGYVDGRAVATAATETAAGVVGIYSVATLADQQRRGYGESITRTALAQAAAMSGCHTTILQSTLAGLPLYRKLGYRDLGRVAVYATR